MLNRLILRWFVFLFVTLHKRIWIYSQLVDANREWSRYGRTTESTASPTPTHLLHSNIPSNLSQSTCTSSTLSFTKPWIFRVAHRHRMHHLSSPSPPSTESTGLLPIQRRKTLDRTSSFASRKNSYSCNAQERHPVGESSPECRPAIPDEKTVFSKGWKWCSRALHEDAGRICMWCKVQVRKISLLHRSTQRALVHVCM